MCRSEWNRNPAGSTGVRPVQLDGNSPGVVLQDPSSASSSSPCPRPCDMAHLPNAVRISINGDFEWTIGDSGQQPVDTLKYGTTYRAVGWTITPTSKGTTFINDTTGRGMTVSAEGVEPFRWNRSAARCVRSGIDIDTELRRLQRARTFPA